MAPTNPTHLEWPVEHPRACLGILHGLGDHAARYSEAAKAFNEMGIACLAAELPGHGRNPGPRGHIPSMDSAYATLDFMVEKCRATFPDLPIFLLGQSMGGNILLNYLLDRTPSVAGAIAMSPWIRLPNPPPRLLEMLARTMNLILPALTLSNGLDPRDLATSPAVAQAYIDDPLTHDRISFRTAVTMFDAAQSTRHLRRGIPRACAAPARGGRQDHRLQRHGGTGQALSKRRVENLGSTTPRALQ
ncbi:MAG: hypothetical protein KatS3mg029_0675 [Saprospiraceae bacterium]|nr:MAG: hypothetical protein KatS3mg029_0675 [Saprospiraceae bacterium]